MYEKAVTPQGIAELFGLSAEYVRAACLRGPGCHPLPHIEVGTKARRHLRIRPSVFQEWLAEEERA